ncbi:MAG: hypothetical protein LBV54_06200, partial [Puniceicoccales bacterium]|nr:hypothetical protein [Puniceicoccales bacterium]
MTLTAREILLAGTLLHSAALIAAVLYLRRTSHPAQRVAACLLAAGFLAQSAGLLQRGGETHLFPLGNTFELLQMFAWGVVTLDGFLRFTFNLRLPVALTAGLAALLGGASFLNPAWDSPATPGFSGNPWIGFHVL